MKVEGDTEMEAFDAKVLMSLVVDLDELDAYAGRVRVQARTSKHHGIALPQPTSPSR